jgi:hypothetical protein
MSSPHDFGFGDHIPGGRWMVYLCSTLDRNIVASTYVLLSIVIIIIY